MAEVLDEREKGAVLVVGRAEMAQAQTRLAVEALFQCRGKARLTDAGVATAHDNLAVPCLSARPVPQQQIDLLIAADQRGQRRPAQRLEPAFDNALSQYLPTAHRLSAIGDLNGAELTVVEQVPDQAAGRSVRRSEERRVLRILPCLSARPVPQQQIDLLIAADQRGQRRPAQRLEPAFDNALSQYLPTAHRLSAIGDLNGAELTVVEQVPDQAAGRSVD